MVRDSRPRTAGKTLRRRQNVAHRAEVRVRIQIPLRNSHRPRRDGRTEYGPQGGNAFPPKPCKAGASCLILFNRPRPARISSSSSCTPNTYRHRKNSNGGTRLALAILRTSVRGTGKTGPCGARIHASARSHTISDRGTGTPACAAPPGVAVLL